MKEETLKNKAESYHDIDWDFSSQIYWTKLVETSPTAYRLVRLADSLRLTGNFKKAHEIFSKVKLSDIPEKYHYHYYMNLGKIYEDQHNIDAAIKNYRKCVELDEDTTVPYIFLAHLLMKKENFAEAEKLLLTALKKEGDVDEAYFNLSLLHASKGEIDKAISAMEACLSLDFDFLNAKRILADLKNYKELTL